MIKTNITDLTIPLNVPPDKIATYEKNFLAATQKTGRLFLFAADQKIEHLNHDFVGPNITPECAGPEHLFSVARGGRIGAFATHLGLITRYAHAYKDTPYIVKLNGKTNIIPTKSADPLSNLLYTVEQAVACKNWHNINIVGVGYTLYLGSEHESTMLEQAAQVIMHAHAYGLLTVLWIYPRGKHVVNEADAALLAGAAGVATALGADFVKIVQPENNHLTQAVTAAGNTGVICAGGAAKNDLALLQTIHAQLAQGARGAAIGRNIFQQPHDLAVARCNALAALVFDGASVQDAAKLLMPLEQGAK